MLEASPSGQPQSPRWAWFNFIIAHFLPAPKTKRIISHFSGLKKWGCFCCLFMLNLCHKLTWQVKKHSYHCTVLLIFKVECFFACCQMHMLMPLISRYTLNNNKTTWRGFERIKNKISHLRTICLLQYYRGYSWMFVWVFECLSILRHGLAQEFPNFSTHDSKNNSARDLGPPGGCM